MIDTNSDYDDETSECPFCHSFVMVGPCCSEMVIHARREFQVQQQREISERRKAKAIRKALRRAEYFERLNTKS